MNARALTATTLLLLSSALAAHAGIELHQEHTFVAAPGKKVVVDVAFHTVEITVRPGDTVQVSVDLEASGSGGRAEKAIKALTPEFREAGDAIVIRSTGKMNFWGGSSGKVKGLVAIAMPPDLDIEVDASSGSISIDGDLGGGRISCDVSSGSVAVHGAAREVAADSSSGSIRVEVSRPLENFSADASSGSIRLEGGAYAASADSSSGSITLAGLRGSATMSASSGSIKGQWDVVGPGAKIRAGASSGDVTLRLPVDTRLNGSVSTSSGGIRSDFPGTFEAHQASFHGGPGAVEIRAETSSGSIKILAN